MRHAGAARHAAKTPRGARGYPARRYGGVRLPITVTTERPVEPRPPVTVAMPDDPPPALCVMVPTTVPATGAPGETGAGRTGIIPVCPSTALAHARTRATVASASVRPVKRPA